MAIIQISKIQHRTGANTDLPQLDEGEFGFATDERKLYIGNDANLYPPAGSNLTTQTEILTQYSDISFSQIDGSANSNLELSNIEDGQVLTVQLIGDISTIVNRGGSTGLGNINLGNVSNVKLRGGVNGYFLQTDGTGNISWVSKDILRTPIIALSNATPVVMTVSNSTPYVNKLKVTITGVLGANANTVVNGQDFYVKMSNDFPTSGNVTLYTDNTLTTPLSGTNLTATANTGYSTSLISDTSGLPGGANSQIQFNNSGLFGASANLTFDTATNTLTATNITGTLSSLASSQPNITSVGTLVDANIAGTVTATKFTSNVATGTPPLTVSSNTRVDNLNADLLDGSHADTTNTPDTIVIRDSDGSFSANIITANLTGSATTAVTVTASAQPNITSLGTLSSVTVTGNIISGNLSATGLISATGNVSGGNLTTAGAISATGNVIGGNLTTSGVATVSGLNITDTVSSDLIPSLDTTYDLGNTTNRWNDIYLSGTTIYIGDQTVSTTANGIALSNTASVGNLVVTSNISTGNLTGANLVSANYIQGVLTTGSQPNITGVGTLSSLSVNGSITATNASLGNLATANYFSGVLTATASSQPNITSVGTLTSLSVSSNFIALGNVYANSGTIGASLLTGTITTNAQPNIRSLGTLTSLGVSGNITSGNVAGGNLVAANYLYGVLTQGQQPNITTVGTLSSLIVSANITSGNLDGGNLVKANYIQGTIITAAQPNITSIGNLSNVIVVGNANIGNVNTATGTGTFNTVVANNITLNNNLNLNNLGASGNVTSNNISGNIVLGTQEVRVGNVTNDNWGRMRMLSSSTGYGFTFGDTPALVITNEEATYNQAMVLGDATGSNTLFGISTYSGNGDPTTGNESGWAPKLTLTGAGGLQVNTLTASSATLSNPLSVSSGGTGSNTSTGTGSVVLSNSPSFAGIPIAPTASAGTSTNQLATTSFVATAVATGTVSLGVGQTWQAVTGSRAYNTNYTNTTGKPISVYARSNDGGTITATVGGVEVSKGYAPDSGHIVSVTFIVPSGSVYRVSSTDTSLGYWAELR